MATSVGTLVRVIGCGQLDRLDITEAGLENHPVSIRNVLSLTKLKSFFTT
jgi:hypothetical protein